MRFNHKGFLAVESLVSFAVLGFMIALFLPAFTLHLNKLKTMADKTHELRQVYEVSQLAMTSHTEPTIDIDLVIDSYLTYHPNITNIELSPTQCHIEFKSGGNYDITFHLINESS